MIKYLLLGGLFLFSCTATFGQSKKPLKGPRAKNQKPWQKKDQPQHAIYHAAILPKRAGPPSKNQKPWANKVQRGNHKMVVPRKRSINKTKLRVRKVW